MFYSTILDGSHQGKDIGLVVMVTIGPVFQIGIHAQPLLAGIVNSPENILNVLIKGFSKLIGAMFFTTFDQQIQYLTTGFPYPVYTAVIIHKAEYFNPPFQLMLFCPVDDTAQCFLLPC